jgi:hypothetical protein
MKKCCICHKDKDLDDFYKNAARKDGLQTYCKKCNGDLIRKRYLENPEYYHDKNAIARLMFKNLSNERLSKKKCELCGESDHRALVFMDNENKAISTSRIVHRVNSLKSLEALFRSYRIRCRNCYLKTIPS